MLLGRRSGLLAGLFLALNFLHVRDSHYIVNDVWMTFSLIMSSLFAARLSREPTPRHYLLAGLFGGLATAMKYSAGLFFVSVLAAHAIVWSGRAASPSAVRRLAAGGLVAAVAFFVTNAFVLFDWPKFLDHFLTQVSWGNSPWFGQSAEPASLLYLLTLAQAMGVVQLALVVVGALALLTHDWRAALLLGTFPAVYAAYMVTKVLFVPRFAMPLIPFLCLFAAAGAEMLVSRLVPARRQRAALPAIALRSFALRFGIVVSSPPRHGRVLARVSRPCRSRGRFR